jgi:hypothetical protein
MNVPYRTAWWMVGLAVLAAGAGYVCWDSTVRLEQRENRTEDDEYQQEVRREQALKARLAAVPRVRVARDRVAGDVVAGRLTLAEAAARFRELDHQVMDPATFAHTLKLHFPGASEEERLCRKVIQHALDLVEQQPDVAAGLQARLEIQLRKHLARQATLARGGG